jgi:hypothetical protein
MAKNAEYSFAICSINLSHFYMFYFQLFPHNSIGTTDLRRAQPHIMKIFARLNLADQPTIHEIHSMAAIEMNEKWTEMSKNSKVTVMDFMKALIYATYFIENVLYTNPESLFEFKRACVNS